MSKFLFLFYHIFSIRQRSQKQNPGLFTSPSEVLKAKEMDEFRLK